MIEHLLLWVSEGGEGINGGAEFIEDHSPSFRVNLLCEFYRINPGWSLSASVWEKTVSRSTGDRLYFVLLPFL